MILSIYNFILILFKPIYYFFKFFDKKFNEREKQVQTQQLGLVQFKRTGKIIWFHSASMGEFEQAKPVIEILKKEHPGIQVVCTFFSPSGYLNQKNYKFADLILYLPFDFRINAKQFITNLKPDIAVFIRYETWANYLYFLKEKAIPCYLICATVPSNKILLKYPLILYTKTIYGLFAKIFSFNHNQFIKFQKLKLNIPIVDSTDTRYDRIIKNVEEAKENRFIPEHILVDELFTLIIGSSWEPEEELIHSILPDIQKKYSNFRLFIVPHEPTPNHINHLLMKFPDAILLSKLLSETDLSSLKIIIVDSIGKLLSLYKFAYLAFIGGGFGVGVHSVAEPAGYGIPLACGPNYTNSPDAVELEKLKALTVIKDNKDLKLWLEQFINNRNIKEETGNISKSYIFGLKGTSTMIAKELADSI